MIIHVHTVVFDSSGWSPTELSREFIAAWKSSAPSAEYMESARCVVDAVIGDADECDEH